MTVLEKIAETKTYLEKKGIERVDFAVISGTGLGVHFVEQLETLVSISYESIPHFPIATVEFHFGKLIYGKLGDKRVLVFQGRFHYYEGLSMEEVTYHVRLSKSMNADYLLITNAAGCMNLDWQKGDLMLINDHINLMTESPLRGPYLTGMGDRFPDMSEPYDSNLNDRIIELAKLNDISLKVGVYIAVVGPNLETKSEYRYMRMIGGDAVGMSTVPEVIVAKQCGLPCAAISVMTDVCDPDNLQPVDIQDIIATAGKAEPALSLLLTKLISSYS